MTDYIEEQENEIEVLTSIYPEELEGQSKYQAQYNLAWPYELIFCMSSKIEVHFSLLLYNILEMLDSKGDVN